MDGNFRIEQLFVSAGEGIRAGPKGTHLLAMADGPTTLIEWEVNRSHERKRVLPGDLWVFPSGYTGWARPEADGTVCNFFSPRRGFAGAPAPPSS